MTQSTNNRRLADRLGVTWHISPLAMKIKRLMKNYPAHRAEVSEDWLVDVAIQRGLQQFVRDTAEDVPFSPPPREEFSDEELVVALCHKAALDRPQMIRMAGHLISRGSLDLKKLGTLIKRERIEDIMSEVAQAALKCDPTNPIWSELDRMLEHNVHLRSPVIHWSRLADPVMDKNHRIAGWKLAS